MSYIGDFKLGDTFDTKFTTRQISGAPSTLGSSPVISAYVGNSTTEITAGITLSVDFDSRTGLNNVRVVATSGNGYATASNYQLVITTGTVNSVSVVGEVIAEFSIENRRADVQFWNGTQVATPATAGIPDVNVKNINNVAAATPGAAGGLFIAGTNAATTITSAGGDALTLSSTGANGVGLKVSGNGSGDAIKATGGATGAALELVGGGTSGDGLKITTTSGHGMNIAATGTSMHGITSTGGNGGTSDGIKAVAGTGGVPIRGDITGNVTGNLSGSVGSVTGAVGSVTGAVGSVTGNVGGNVVGSVASVTARVSANVDQVDGSALTAHAAGKMPADVLTWLGGAIPAVNVTGVPLVDLKYTLGTISPAAAGSVRADAVTGAVGSVTGAVGSVTGAVGSVTGNVGGNVVGSVASVTAAVTLTAAYDFAKGTAAIAESYRANGAAPTPAQALCEILAHLGEVVISSTTKTVNKFDHATAAATYTLDSALTPAAITRAT